MTVCLFATHATTECALTPIIYSLERPRTIFGIVSPREETLAEKDKGEQFSQKDRFVKSEQMPQPLETLTRLANTG